nr:unnamed protein product [uncultured bacterium]
MANYEKFTRNGTANLFAHFDRTLKNNSNKDIKPEQTHLNYNLAPDQISSPNEILKKRLAQVKVLKRKDVNVLCSWVVTLPKDFDGDEKAFFRATYDFLENKYGSKNVVSAWVHKDEKQPHLHFAFVPVVIDKKKQVEKVSAKECVTKTDLMTFHDNLQVYLESALGQEVHILNGATKSGNLTVRELKIAEKEKDLKRREKTLSDAEIGLVERSKTLDEQETHLNDKKAFLDDLERYAEKAISELEEPKPLGDISKQREISSPGQIELNFKPEDSFFTKESRSNFAFRVVKSVWKFAQKKVDETIQKFNHAKETCRILAEALGTKSADLTQVKKRLDKWEKMTPEEGYATFGAIAEARNKTSGKVQNWDDYKEWQNEQKQKKRQQNKKIRTQDFGIGY